MFPHIFSPIKIGRLEIKNRLVMAPMGSNYADEDGYVTDQLISYYKARAVGGVGLITVEGAFPELRGKVLAKQIGLHKNDVISGLQRLAEAIHDGGAKAAIQILHAGRQTREKICGQKPVAPSPIPCPVCQEKPHELTAAEIDEIVHSHVKAAVRARTAGFDAVELHCAHGYLINQFLSPYSNYRSDDYGGTTENRTRLILRIIEQIRKKTDPMLVIGCRISADEFVTGGLKLPESIRIAKILEQNGVDYLSVSGGVYESIQHVIPPIYTSPGSLVHLAEEIKKAASIPIATVGGFTEPELMEKILKEQKADLVLLGRALLADPEFPLKSIQGDLQNIIPCVACNNCRRRDLRPEINCMMNYRTGRESEIYLKPASSKQTVVVVGGGPAGMEAARVARIRGHEVILLEKTDRLGGQLNLAAVPPGKKRFVKVTEYLENQLQDLGVQIKVNTEADLKTIQTLAPTAIIFAIGAEPIVPPIKGIEKIPYSFARTIFQKQKVDEAVKRVLILGGGQVGCELSKLLLSENKNVCLVEISDRLAGEMEFGSRNILLEVLFSYEKNFQPYTSTEISDVKSSSVCQLRRYNEIFEIQDIDMLIIAAGSQACRPFWDNKTITGKAYIIGDAKQPRSALEAIHEGFQAGAAV